MISISFLAYIRKILLKLGQVAVVISKCLGGSHFFLDSL